MVKNRLYFLDFLKLFFAILIALSHFGYTYNISLIGVEFFFCISGFYLIKKYEQNKDKDYTGYNYVQEMVSKIYFKYIVAFFLFYLISARYMLKYGSTIKEIINYFIKMIPEIFLVQNIGVFSGGINYPLWYFCILVIAGYFMYTILTINERFSRAFLFPLLCMFGYVFLKNSQYDMWGSIGIFHMPFIRGTVALLLGALYYEIYKKNWLQKLRFPDIYIILSLILLYKIGIKFNLYLILMGVVIILSQRRDLVINKIFNQNIFSKFQNLSLSIFLVHGLTIKLFNEHIHIDNSFDKRIIFIILTIIVAIVFDYLTNLIRKKMTFKFFIKNN